MKKHIFVCPEGKASPRWQQAFDSIQLVHDSEAAMSPMAQLVWITTAMNDWAEYVGRTHAQGVRTVVLSNTPDVIEAARAFDAGANGYAHAWSAPDLLQQIDAVVSNGGHWLGPDLMQRLVLVSRRIQPTGEREDRVMLLAALSHREIEVAEGVAEGKSNKEIAHDLGITERTVKAHLAAVFEKLAVRDRLHLALKLASAVDDNLAL